MYINTGNHSCTLYGGCVLLALWEGQSVTYHMEQSTTNSKEEMDPNWPYQKVIISALKNCFLWMYSQMDKKFPTTRQYCTMWPKEGGYGDTIIKWGILKRQILQNSLHELCLATMNKQPSETGTIMSALKHHRQIHQRLWLFYGMLQHALSLFI